MLHAGRQINEPTLELTGFGAKEFALVDSGTLLEGVLAYAVPEFEHHGSNFNEQQPEGPGHSEGKRSIFELVGLRLGALLGEYLDFGCLLKR